MKISRNWLQTFFDAPLPGSAAIADALTFHVFEIDGIDPVKSQDDHGASDEVLDVKVTANRGHDCLSHRGIAKELSAILNVPMKADPLRGEVALEPKTDKVAIIIEDSALCPRFSAAYITGVKVGPSPDWLRQRLEAMGQHSINNVVDATNFVMFNIGQPLHAFDAGKLVKKDGTYSLYIRGGKDGGQMLGLDDKQYTLAPSMLVIADANKANEAVSIAGIKGGKPTGIDGTTVDVILEAANWNGAAIRKTSQTLKLRTDASARFEQVISPELAAFGLRAGVELILELAGGTIAGFVDEYPRPQEIKPVSVSLGRINDLLGTTFSTDDVTDIFKRLGLPFTQEGDTYVVTPPFERLDLMIPEDLIEEVGRIIGYDKVPTTELPPPVHPPEINMNFYAAEKVREELTEQGFSEVYTSVFADKGQRVVANKVDGTRPYLRTNLIDGLTEAVKKNIPNKDLLGLDTIRLFEIGTVWHEGTEEVVVAAAQEKEEPTQSPLSYTTTHHTYENLPLSTAGRYRPFSKYPYIVRDISFWLPTENPAQTYKEFVDTVFANAGNASIQVSFRKVDQYEKDGRTSLAFRLIFQSFERTLTDAEVNVIMETVAAALKGEGFEIR